MCLYINIDMDDDLDDVPILYRNYYKFNNTRSAIVISSNEPKQTELIYYCSYNSPGLDPYNGRGIYGLYRNGQTPNGECIENYIGTPYTQMRLLTYIPFTIFYDSTNNNFYTRKGGISIEIVEQFIQLLKTEILEINEDLQDDLNEFNPAEIEKYSDELKEREEYIGILESQLEAKRQKQEQGQMDIPDSTYFHDINRDVWYSMENGESLEIQTPDDNALKQQIDQKKPEYINKIMGVIDVLEGINTNLKEFIRVLELINEDVVIDVDLDLDESDFLQLIQLIISYNNIFIQKLQEIITEIETEYITKNTIIIFNNICDYMINGVLLVNCISSSRSYQEKINYLHEYIQGTNKLSCLGPDVLQKTRNNLITKYKIIENTDQQLVELSMHLYEIKNRELSSEYALEAFKQRNFDEIDFTLLDEEFQTIVYGARDMSQMRIITEKTTTFSTKIINEKTTTFSRNEIYTMFYVTLKTVLKELYENSGPETEEEIKNMKDYKRINRIYNRIFDRMLRDYHELSIYDFKWITIFTWLFMRALIRDIKNFTYINKVFIALQGIFLNLQFKLPTKYTLYQDKLSAVDKGVEVERIYSTQPFVDQNARTVIDLTKQNEINISLLPTDDTKVNDPIIIDLTNNKDYNYSDKNKRGSRLGVGQGTSADPVIVYDSDDNNNPKRSKLEIIDLSLSDEEFGSGDDPGDDPGDEFGDDPDGSGDDPDGSGDGSGDKVEKKIKRSTDASELEISDFKKIKPSTPPLRLKSREPLIITRLINVGQHQEQEQEQEQVREGDNSQWNLTPEETKRKVNLIPLDGTRTPGTNKALKVVKKGGSSMKGGNPFPFSKTYMGSPAGYPGGEVVFRYDLITVILQILLYFDSMHDFKDRLNTLNKAIVPVITTAFNHLHSIINIPDTNPNSYFNKRRRIEAHGGNDVRELLDNYKNTPKDEWGGYENVIAYRYKQDAGLSEMTILKYIYINPNNINDPKNFFSLEDLQKLGDEGYIFRSPSSAPKNPNDAKHKVQVADRNNQWYSYFVLMNIDGSKVVPLATLADLDEMRAYSDNPISKDILAFLFGLVDETLVDSGLGYNCIDIRIEDETAMTNAMKPIENVYIPGLADPSTTSPSVPYDILVNTTINQLMSNEQIHPIPPNPPVANNATQTHPNNLMRLSMQAFLDLYANPADPPGGAIPLKATITNFSPILAGNQYSGISITINGTPVTVAGDYQLHLKDTQIEEIEKLLKKLFDDNTINYVNTLTLAMFNGLVPPFTANHQRILQLSIMYYNNMMPKYKNPTMNKNIFLSCILMWKAFGDYWEITYVYGLDYLEPAQITKYFITSTDKNVALMMMWLGVYGIIAKTSVHLPDMFNPVTETKNTDEQISLLKIIDKVEENFITKQMGEGMLTNIFSKEINYMYNVENAKNTIIDIARRAKLMQEVEEVEVVEEVEDMGANLQEGNVAVGDPLAVNVDEDVEEEEDDDEDEDVGQITVINEEQIAAQQAKALEFDRIINEISINSYKKAALLIRDDVLTDAVNNEWIADIDAKIAVCQGLLQKATTDLPGARDNLTTAQTYNDQCIDVLSALKVLSTWKQKLSTVPGLNQKFNTIVGKILQEIEIKNISTDTKMMEIQTKLTATPDDIILEKEYTALSGIKSELQKNKKIFNANNVTAKTKKAYVTAIKTEIQNNMLVKKKGIVIALELEEAKQTAELDRLIAAKAVIEMDDADAGRLKVELEQENSFEINPLSLTFRSFNPEPVIPAGQVLTPAEEIKKINKKFISARTFYDIDYFMNLPEIRQIKEAFTIPPDETGNIKDNPFTNIDLLLDSIDQVPPADPLPDLLPEFTKNIYQGLKQVRCTLDFNYEVRKFLPSAGIDELENICRQFTESYYQETKEKIFAEIDTENPNISQKQVILFETNHFRFMNKLKYVHDQIIWAKNNVKEGSYPLYVYPIEAFNKQIQTAGETCIKLLEDLKATIVFAKDQKNEEVTKMTKEALTINTLITRKDDFLVKHLNSSNKLTPQLVIELLNDIKTYVTGYEATAIAKLTSEGKRFSLKSIKRPYEFPDEKEYLLLMSNEPYPLPRGVVDIKSDKNVLFETLMNYLTSQDPTGVLALGDAYLMNIAYNFLSKFVMGKVGNSVLIQQKITAFISALNIQPGSLIKDLDTPIKTAFDELLEIDDVFLKLELSEVRGTQHELIKKILEFKLDSQNQKEQEKNNKNLYEKAMATFKKIGKAVSKKVLGYGDTPKVDVEKLTKKQFSQISSLISILTKAVGPFQKRPPNVVVSLFTTVCEKNENLLMNLKKIFEKKKELLLKSLESLVPTVAPGSSINIGGSKRYTIKQRHDQFKKKKYTHSIKPRIKSRITKKYKQKAKKKRNSKRKI